ncbi:MAG: acireductone synthase, partial [Myxococcota bacterium]
NGEFKGHVYEDAAEGLRRWYKAKFGLYAYSSGSVKSQKLLFSHSEAGDLTSLMSGYFDTTTGPKRDAESYRSIASAIGLPEDGILFLSDVAEELDAARKAGMRTIQLLRDDSVKVGNHDTAKSFETIFP